MDLPAPGLGTFPLTGAAAERLTFEAAASGWRLFDTAQMYGNEAEVGAGLRAAALPRDSYRVITKIHHDRFDDGTALASAAASVERLGLGPVDLLLVHWPPARTDVPGVMAVLNRCLEDGLTRAIGVSNFNRGQMRQAAGLGPVVANEVEFHPYLDQRALLAEADALGVRLIGYRSIARGRVLAEPAVAQAARAHGVDPAAVALAWAMAKGVVPLCNTSRPERLAANFAAATLALSEREMNDIDALSSRDMRLCDPGWQADWNG